MLIVPKSCGSIFFLELM